MFAVYEYDFGFAILLVVCVVDEARFVAETRGVNDPVAVEVEEEGQELAVIDDAAALCFRGGDDLCLLISSLLNFRVKGIRSTSPAYSLR
jgi:hypothetical protein